MAERTWNVGDRVIVLSDEENSGQARHTNRTGQVADINPADLRGWHFGVRFDGDSPDAKPSWFAGHELAPAPGRPSVEVWRWEDVPEAWRALWAERFPAGLWHVEVHEYLPYRAVVSRPAAAGDDNLERFEVVRALDVDGCHRFDLPNGDRLDVIVAPRRQETQP